MRSEPATTRFAIRPQAQLRAESTARRDTPSFAAPTDASRPTIVPIPEMPADGTDRSRRPTTCDQVTVRDAGGDGPIDITSVEITSNCRDVRFLVTTAQPIQSSRLRRFGITFGDVDNRPRSGCDGMERLLLVEPVGGVLSGSFHFLTGCTYSTGTPVTVERPSANSIAVTVQRNALNSGAHDIAAFRWQAFTVDAASGDVDAAPEFAAAAWDAGAKPRFSARSSADGRSVDIAMDINPPVARSYEVRYRMVGGRWSPVRRVAFNDRDVSISGLTPGGRYEIAVAARSTVGRGAPQIETVRHYAPPGPISITGVTLADSLLTVTFDLPTDTGGYKGTLARLSLITDDGEVRSLRSPSDGIAELRLPPPPPFTVYARFSGATRTSWHDSDVTTLRVTELPPD
jgi:hypothetical protein